jgi:acetyl-CoA C-acetyltransferase
MDPRTPVLVGAGQVTNRRERVVDAHDLMVEAAGAALADAGPRLKAVVEAVWGVDVLSGAGPSPARTVGERLGLSAGVRATTTIGGNTPQWLVARACDAVVAGELSAVLIAGAEAMDSGKRAGEGDHRGRMATPKVADGDMVLGDARSGVGPSELAAGLAAPAHLYPLFESVLAARAGRSPTEQRAWLGRFLAPMTKQAASHPDLAWFPAALTPEQIATPGADNRLVAEPYTKRMNSIIQVDQGAAVVVTSVGAARSAGVSSDRFVFPWSAAECNDVFLPSERPDVGRSEGVAAAGSGALAAAGIGIDDVSFFDLYSCFPCAMQMGAAALGLDPFDERGLTITGAMPYFGGPGNNYVTHALAMMMDRCRAEPDAVGLVTGLGWYATKHAVGLYGSRPPEHGWRHADCSFDQARIDSSALAVATDATAAAEVEAMTVIHDRVSGPIAAPVFARLADGRRVVAAAADSALPAALVDQSLVGCTVAVRPGEGGSVYETR